MSRLRIGIVVDSALKQQYLTNLVAQAGHLVVYTSLLSATAPESADSPEPLDAWVIDLAEAEVTEDIAIRLQSSRPKDDVLLEQLFEGDKVPIILSDSSDHPPGSESHQGWLRRMELRLRRLSGDINLQQTDRAPYLWILAASTGGPAAVKEFLSHLPGKLGIAFVYVQHIDAHYSATLVRMMSSAGNYPTSPACQGTVLQRNTITLVTAEHSVEIFENGTLLVNEKSWGGCYAPSIDQLAANVARTYRERSGLIIFTGMGDDGAASSRLIKQQGGRVWVQSPDSCTSSSMPEAALATQCVTYSGTPKELAQRLAVFSRQHMPIKQFKGKRSYESSTTNPG